MASHAFYSADKLIANFEPTQITLNAATTLMSNLMTVGTGPYMNEIFVGRGNVLNFGNNSRGMRTCINFYGANAHPLNQNTTSIGVMQGGIGMCYNSHENGGHVFHINANRCLTIAEDIMTFHTPGIKLTNVLQCDPFELNPNKICLGTARFESPPLVDAMANVKDTRVVGFGNDLAGLRINTASRIRMWATPNIYPEMGPATSIQFAQFIYGNVVVDGGSVAGQAGKLHFGPQLSDWQLTLLYNSAFKPGSALWTTTSDERIKANIEPANLDICYDTVRTVPLKRFEWKEPLGACVGDRKVLGWLAQDVGKVLPKAVTMIDEMYGIENFLSLDSDQIVKCMYGALQKCMAEIETLKNRLRALETMRSVT